MDPGVTPPPTPEPTPRETQDPGGRWLSPGVASVGAASLFSDASHEMTTSVLPTFLASTLHAGPGVLGAIEGVSDAITGLCKLAGGPLAVDPARRARLASGGYLGTAVATAAIGATTAVWQVAALRAFAWASRGIRGPARDLILTTLTPRSAYGRAFGVERFGDNTGAVLGPLLAAALVGLIGVRETILVSLIPGLLAAVAITVAARAAASHAAVPEQREALRLNLRALRGHGLGRALAPVVLFELGNLATTMLILRATGLLTGQGRDLTTATSLAVVMYAAHNGIAALASLAAGHLADRRTPRVVFAIAATSYVAGYGLFAVGGGWPLLLAGFLLSGIGIGLAETAESTIVALALPEHLRGQGFGVLGLTQSFGDLGATVVAGLLWAAFTPTVAFLYAAAWMAASLTAALLIRPTRHSIGTIT
ncbi:MAG: MFS transporter [Dermatophilaceae bacterium]